MAAAKPFHHIILSPPKGFALTTGRARREAVSPLRGSFVWAARSPSASALGYALSPLTELRGDEPAALAAEPG